MKVSRIFAGLLIILLGIALFLSNFDVLTMNWHFIFRLWPILLVFAGISVLVSNPKLKALLYAVTAILVLVWVFSVASAGWGNFHGIFHGGSRHAHSQQFTENFDKDVRHAVLTINAGAGSIFINDTTNELLNANTESNIGDYSLDVDKNVHTENLDLTMEKREEHWFFGSEKNKVDIKLNPIPDWKLDMDVGACSLDFDLSPYVISSADLKAGASSMKIRLGDRSDTTQLSINAGVSSISIYVPESSGCQIRDEAKLSSKSYTDFVKFDDGLYKTANFESSKKKIFIDMEAGVSSIKVSRY
jgi:hypothetical protein